MARFNLVLLLATCLCVVEATITVMETGRVFPSRPDDYLGQPLWRGYEYMARMQILENNLSLCHPGNYTVEPTDDGMYVALLVRAGGGCSLRQKAEYVLSNVKPEGLVKYLIVDGSDGDIDNVEEWQKELEDIPRKHRGDDKHRLPLHILHVSYKAEYELLGYILHQSNETKREGGVRVAIDGRLHGDAGQAGIWIALCAIISACACSFILVLGGISPPEDPPTPPPPRRRQLPRLTREQVRELYPVFRFDGAQLQSTGEHEAPAEVAHELDACSICLDEYEEGDRMRCLPCHHAFHSRCIGKWLSERSATCPLCKIDLYIEEESESESEASEVDGAEAVAAAEPPVEEEQVERESWWSRWTGSRERDDARAEESDRQSARDSWWRRIFPTRDETEQMLAEPLLAAEDVEAGRVEVDAVTPADAEEVDEEEEANRIRPLEETVGPLDETPDPTELEGRQVTV